MGANLQEANLHNANLQGADLMSANLEGADLMGASLREAGLGGAKLKGAKSSKKTIWPENFEPKKAGLSKWYLILK